MENNKNKFVIKKVPLHGFIEILNRLYMDGADYVDLKVNLNVNNLNDKITMFVPMEYLTEEARAAAEEQIKEEQTAPPPPGIEIDEEGNEQIVPPMITEEELKDLLEACYA